MRRYDAIIIGAGHNGLACATCHVIVDPAFAGLLDEITPEEEEMLDLAVGVEANSRLGCQIVLSEALDGLTDNMKANLKYAEIVANAD